MPLPLDSAAVRNWCALALEALREERGALDAINVFPVADGDTGTNLYRTLDAGARGLDGQPDAADPLAVLARSALLGACGNSGTILAQLLYGLAESDGGSAGEGSAGALEAPESPGARLARALREAAGSAYAAVAHPVEGTMLTVAAAAAEAAERAAGEGGDVRAVAYAADAAARAALSATTSQLPVLARSSVVDAGARGLTLVLGALARALSGEVAASAEPLSGGSVNGAGSANGARAEAPVPAPAPPSASPSYEVMYLLDAGEEALGALREALDALPGADSLVIGGGHALWSVHVHTDDAGAAVEAGIAAGHPHRIRITHLPGPGATAVGACAGAPATTTPAARSVVAVVAGDGLAELCREAGAAVVRVAPGAHGTGGCPDAGGTDAKTLLDALHATGSPEAVLLPNDPDLRATAVHAAGLARAEGLRVAVIPTRAAVQGIAALAVHEPDRGFDEDVVAMTAAAGATRYGEVAVAERQSWTMAGICQAGDVLGLVDGDVAVIGTDVGQVATDVLERMLAAGGEMVTLVLGSGAEAGLAERLEEHVRRAHLAVDTVVYDGRQSAPVLLVGVE
ncbi:DAK2 domain-containing protein [Streptomyces sp. ODS28]|uniref:DAK2 domain-containing protein n=1 Tax=Streptomyces sp. ODS28 TaxID=3136688 RepID=UPI0031E61A9A